MIKNEKSKSIYLSEDNLKKIAKVLSISKIPHKAVKHLERATQEYLSDKHYTFQTLRPKEIKSQLSNLKTSVNDLIKSIEQVDIDSLDKLSCADFPKYLDLFELKDNRPFLYELKRIYDAAQNAEADLGPIKGGRPIEQAALRSFIINLASIYEDLTNEEAGISYNNYINLYQGPFYIFAESILAIIDKDAIYSNSAFGKQIKIALKTAKSLPKPNFDRISTIPHD